MPLHILFLAAVVQAACAAEFGFDAMAFGASYHTNRDHAYREFNPGGAGAIWCAPFAARPEVEAFIAMGAYKNSSDKGSFLQQAGARYVHRVAGDLTAGVFVGYGVITGYAQPLTATAGVSIGWSRLNVECAYHPSAPIDGGEATGVLAGWVRLRLWSF